MKELWKNNKLFVVELNLICLTILLYLDRVAIPFLKYPFILFYSLLILYAIVKYKRKVFSSVAGFSGSNYLILVLLLIMIFSYLFSNKLYLTVFKDLFNTVILISFFFIAGLFVRTKSNLESLLKCLIYQLILFSFLVSVVQLMRIFDVVQDSYLITAEENIPLMSIDNNFAILQVIFGVIGLFIVMNKTKTVYESFFYNSLLLIFSISIVFSSSRRGLIVLFVCLFCMIILEMIRLIRRGAFKDSIKVDFRYYLVSFFTLLIFTWYFFDHSSYEKKNNALELFGTKNLLDTKLKISGIALKYVSIYDKSATIASLYSSIWTPAFNPDDPESSWGTRFHKTIYPLTGGSVEIVPSGSKGYLMDSTCNPSYYKSNNVCESYSLVANLKTKDKDHIKSSVYCYVSDNFDGNSVSYTVGDDTKKSGKVTGLTTANYDLNSKGIWRKLELDFACDEGEVPLYLCFHKTGVLNFSGLSGYVIFAHPEYRLFHAIDTNVTSHVKYIAKSRYRFESASFFGLRLSGKSLAVKLMLVKRDNDPIRKWAQKLISEDTTYFPYKSLLFAGSGTDDFSDSRIARWQFGWSIFSREFNVRQKLTGGGFSFLNWYGYYFLKNKTASDWPHNPFLTILLYSGIIGLIIYLFFLYKVFLYYFKYLRYYPHFLILFLITFFFSFFSGGSPFDPPVMGFFVILPFFIHSVHINDEKEKNDLELSELQ
jgi:hypothetical protein